MNLPMLQTMERIPVKGIGYRNQKHTSSESVVYTFLYNEGYIVVCFIKGSFDTLIKTSINLYNSYYYG